MSEYANIQELTKFVIEKNANGYSRNIVEVYDTTSGEWLPHPIDHFRIGSDLR